MILELHFVERKTHKKAYFMIKMFNKLPLKIRNIETLEAFKRVLKEHIRN